MESKDINLNVTSFGDIQFTNHTLGSGKHAVVLFPNLYGASIVGGARGLYGDGENTFELAVVKLLNPDDPTSWVLTYDTPITDDVLGWLSIPRLEETLEAISKLPPIVRLRTPEDESR